MKIYDRKHEVFIKEDELGQGKLKFLYETVVGRCLLKIATSSFVSRLNARLNSSHRSRKKIENFIQKYDIDMSNITNTSFSSYNDFFTRSYDYSKLLKYECDVLISPAASKLQVFDIDDELQLSIKQSIYMLSDLIQNDISDEYKGGKCLVFRLSVDDYHRYIHIDDGRLLESKRIKGRLHTVRPLAQKRVKVYSENTRVVSLLETKHASDIYWIEVGALLVGRINNHKHTDFSKYDEKGYFELGGSTIIILFKKDVIKLDKDIEYYSKKGYEIKVALGERIGELLC